MKIYGWCRVLDWYDGVAARAAGTPGSAASKAALASAWPCTCIVPVPGHQFNTPPSLERKQVFPPSSSFHVPSTPAAEIASCSCASSPLNLGAIQIFLQERIVQRKARSPGLHVFGSPRDMVGRIMGRSANCL